MFSESPGVAQALHGGIHGLRKHVGLGLQHLPHAAAWAEAVVCEWWAFS